MRLSVVIVLLFTIGGWPGIESCKTVVETVMDDSQFSMLAEALQIANLTGMLNDEGIPLTVFAPTNVGFNLTLSMLGVMPDSFFGDVESLTTVLLTHVVPMAVTDLGAVGSLSLPTMDEYERLTLSLNNGLYSVMDANSVKILDPEGIMACQDVIYPIDGVLLPKQLSDMLEMAMGMLEMAMGMEEMFGAMNMTSGMDMNSTMGDLMSGFTDMMSGMIMASGGSDSGDMTSGTMDSTAGMDMPSGMSTGMDMPSGMSSGMEESNSTGQGGATSVFGRRLAAA